MGTLVDQSDKVISVLLVVLSSSFRYVVMLIKSFIIHNSCIRLNKIVFGREDIYGLLKNMGSLY